jgi:PKD repeat protein
MVASGAASATPASNAFSVAVTSASADLGGFPIVAVEPTTLSVFNLTIAAHATWSGDISTTVGWDTSNVRQGANLDLSRVSPLTSGHIDVGWAVTGTVKPLGLGSGVNIGTINLSASNVSCTPALSGPNFTCTATSGGPPLVETPGIPLSPYVKLAIKVTFTITPNGAVVSRTFSIGGAPVAGPTDLSLTDSPQSETFSVPCTAAVGASVAYALDPYHWTPPTAAAQQPVIQIGLMDPILGLAELPAIVNIPFGPEIDTTPAFDLTGPGQTTSVGSVLANNVKPTISPFGTFSGSEGAPVQFSATTSSQCPISSYDWQFSDGGEEFGPSPQHIFADDGVYSGQLTVTDVTGLTATQDFTVDISNVAPSVDAGPAKTSLWGLPVAFHANGSDPSPIDNASLLYSWDFGDPASPVGAVGQDVAHTYANPGLYTATVTVTDLDGATGTATVAVTVTTRATTAAYTGPLMSLPAKVVTLTGSLSDELGQPVAGRTVTFTLGTQTITAVTSASGVATASLKLTQKQGTYPVSMTFTGDALYQPAASATTFTIGK